MHKWHEQLRHDEVGEMINAEVGLKPLGSAL